MSKKSNTTHLHKFVRYTIVGASAAVINLVVFVVCEKIFTIYYLISTFIAFIFATYWNFIIARRFVFVSHFTSTLKESLIIYLVSAMGICIDIGVMYVGVDVCNLDSLLTKILAIGIAFVFNFGLRNFVIYKEQL
ncbi:GtrA family protein [Helicobacter equorum]|uniref:GtrA family protein n=1 Tax=Helicobacter equorum TaxID=361872 RepID=UPI000CF165B2|nr:GtrA family protein [Helicobacter equorum]